MRQTALTAFEDQNEDRNFYQLTYPENYIFAHSRHTYINIDRLSDADNIPNSGGTVLLEIKDNDTNITYSEARYLDWNGKADFDIGRYLHILMEDTLRADADFDTTANSKLVANHSVTVRLKYGGVWFWTYDFEVVNGADEPTDNWWDGQRRLRWWYQFPFTFDFRNIDEASIQKNGGAVIVGNLPQITPDTKTYSRIRINATSVGGLWANTLRVSSNYGMGFIDGGFSGNKSNSVLLIGNGCQPSEQNAYLRWLNRHGELNYWLFNRYSQQRSIKASDYQRAYIKDERIGANATIDNALLRTLTIEGEMTVYTDALDGIDYEIVRQIFTAPFVDLYLPDQSDRWKKAVWKRLNIKAGSQTEALRHTDTYTQNRQVTITLTLPEEGQIFV